MVLKPDWPRSETGWLALSSDLFEFVEKVFQDILAMQLEAVGQVAVCAPYFHRMVEADSPFRVLPAECRQTPCLACWRA